MLYTISILMLLAISITYWLLAGKVRFVPGNKSSAKVSAIISIILLVMLFSPFSIIQSHERGLRFTMGSIENVELKPGLQFKFPVIQSIRPITIRPIMSEFKVTVGPDGAITKDNQTIGAQLAIFYTYNQGQLVEMFKNYGEEKLESIISKTMVECFKSQIGRYDIFSLPIAQDSIRNEVIKNIKRKMAKYPLVVTELKITNYDWSDEFDKQIAQTMASAQQVQQKKQELLIAEQVAQKQVKEAEATKVAMVTIAQGEKEAAILRAEAKASEGEGIKKYNDAIRQNMDLEIKFREIKVKQTYADRWNGVFVPTNHYGPIPVQTGGAYPNLGTPNPTPEGN